ncbi:MAG: aminoacyl-tRNA hydrolase [Chitinivibrionales bacterium]|nr:aminoacyl-tRNA hydrolase [Chitinivibrionales bacterium]
MIKLTDSIWLCEQDFTWRFTRSPGPGGQHVNKADTGVQLCVNVASVQLPNYLQKRLYELFPGYITSHGELQIDAHEHRSQAMNKREALDRLRAFIARAAERPKPRKRTSPSRAAREKRLNRKKMHGRKKQFRRPIDRSQLSGE